MLVRIVKMEFSPSKLDLFLTHFNKNKEEIRHFPGCSFLEIWQDSQNPNIIFSHSHWDSEQALNEYRNSDFFKSVWSYTKELFQDKPKAWSVKTLYKLE